MFADYYNILEITYPSSPEEIKESYRRLSLKWHPDRNPGVDTSKQMVAINEAYYILKDPIKKNRYDVEYLRYCNFKNSQHHSNNSTKNESEPKTSSAQSYTHKEERQSNRGYNYANPDVKQDIYEAHNYAKDLVDEFLKHLKQTTKDAAKGAWGEMWPYFIVALILPIFFGLIRSCQ